jgi:hypothetical protein
MERMGGLHRGGGMRTNMVRFVAEKVVTESGRTRRWLVRDRRDVFPLWFFDQHKDGNRNRDDAKHAANILNRGWAA